MKIADLLQQVEARHQQMLRPEWEYMGAATRLALQDNHKALIEALKSLRQHGHGHRKEKAT
jgi:hypothetical protein